MKNDGRIGLLGGTFDPVHIGHLAAASETREAFALDSVWFIPAAIPPHKKKHESGQLISSFEDRTAMLERAVAGRPDFVISRIESERPRPSYTVDTLTLLRRQLGARTKIFFIVGADAFAEIATWKDYTRLPTYADLVVISRPNHQLGKVEEVVRQYFEGYRHHGRECVWRPRECVWLPEDDKKGKIYFLEIKAVTVSSTEIRRMVYAGLPIDRLVPPGVAEYIREHRLYDEKVP